MHDQLWRNAGFERPFAIGRTCLQPPLCPGPQVLLFPAMKPDAAEKPATDGVAALSIVSAAVS